MADPRMRPSFIIGCSILVLMLVISLFALTSLRLPFISPSDASETIVLFALSSIIFLALVIFGFILFRSLLKLYLERRANQLGSKFKTKLVMGAIGLSVLPVCFLFLFSYSLINRTLDKWFSRPFDSVSQDAQEIVSGLDQYARRTLSADAKVIAGQLAAGGAGATPGGLKTLREQHDLDYVGVFRESGLLEEDYARGVPADFARNVPWTDGRPQSELAAQVFEREGQSYAVARAPIPGPAGSALRLLVGMKLPANIAESAARLNRESVLYGELTQDRKLVRKTYLSILLLLTLLILFIATWFALFLSRQVTVPIQALAQATQEVSRGNLAYRVDTRAADELGILVRSFNEMTEQLQAGRAHLEESRNRLQQAHFQLDQRHRFTEAILESIPTGVISISGDGTVLGVNSAAARLFARKPEEIRHLSGLLASDDWEELRYLMKRALRFGQAGRSFELQAGGRTVSVAVTVAALSGEAPGLAGGNRSSGWFVIVMEDLSELLQAQKAAAWGEIAQRVAHEIKNPLTPIALSAERIRLWVAHHKGAPQARGDFQRVIDESCALIGQEVEHLKRLVQEFSQFARFPQARPVPGNLNKVVQSALASFNGRLDGIQVSMRLAENLPSVLVDEDQFRRVVVNLVDNAAEAMQESMVKELVISTRTDAERAVVEAEVADTGCGVTPAQKEKLFSPFYSTKDRGTGLGLAIVSRIIAEHNGSIRVEENEPIGTRFIVELPVRPAERAAEPGEPARPVV